MALSNSEKVARSRQKILQEGGRRLPNIYLQPEDAEALDALLRAEYAPTATAVMVHALRDAARKIGWPRKA